MVDEPRITLPKGISITTILAVLAAFVGLVVNWTHFENRASNNAKDIASLGADVDIIRSKLRDLERDYDRQITHVNAVLDTVTKTPAHPTTNFRLPQSESTPEIK